MSIAATDPKRWEHQWALNCDVMQSLRNNGDDPTVVREVDVSFRGAINALRRLEASCSNFGFEVQEFLEVAEDGDPWLFLVREQTTDDEAIREMTETYLLIEDSFGVECDGWGCLAANRNGPIDNENPA